MTKEWSTSWRNLQRDWCVCACVCMWERKRKNVLRCVCLRVGGGWWWWWGGGVLGCEWMLLSLACSCCSVSERQRGCPCMPLTLPIHSLPPFLCLLSISVFIWASFREKQVNKTTMCWKKSNIQTKSDSDFNVDGWRTGRLFHIITARDRQEIHCRRPSMRLKDMPQAPPLSPADTSVYCRLVVQMCSWSEQYGAFWCLWVFLCKCPHRDAGFTEAIR